MLDEFSKQADRDELKARHHHQYAQHQQGPIANRTGAHEPQNRKVGQDRKADPAEEESGPTKNMKRARRITRVEHHAEEVESALEQAAHSIFRFAVLASAVIDRDLTDPEALPMQDDGDETMKFAVQAQTGQCFRPVCFEAAIEVMKADTGQMPDNAIKDF